MAEYFIETYRLGFSHWEEGDLALATKLWGEPEVTRYISATGLFDEQAIAARLALECDNQRSYKVQYWPVFALLTGDLVGCCGLRPYDLEQDVYELGVHLRSAYWGQGLAKEACRAAMDYAFETLGAADLFAGHHPENRASAALLQSLGFHRVGEEFYAPTGLNHPSYRYRNP